MKIFKRASLILKSVIIWPLYILSCCVPRNKYLWVFGSFRNTFIDNSKYLFINCSNTANSGSLINAVWISPSRHLAETMRADGYKSYWKYSIAGLYYCLRASVYVYSWTVSDINFWLSGGATRLSLWHGIPLKKIGFDIYGKKDSFKDRVKTFFYKVFYPDDYVIPDYFLSTRSAEISAIFERAYPAKSYLHSVYPRVEHFIYGQKQQQEFLQAITTPKEKELIAFMGTFDHVLIYMPTFRDHSKDDEEMRSKNVFDLDILNKILKETNSLLLVKFHVSMQERFNKEANYSNIHFVDPAMDVYVVLPYTTALITDYSSVFFDYMLLNKPILFYNFDMEAYNKNSREFYFPYTEVACGPIMVNFNELCEQLKNSEYLNYPYDFDKQVARIWGNVDQPFLLDHLKSILYK